MTEIAPIAPPRSPEAGDAALRRASQEFEATFLAEMLRSAGLGSTPSALGGGPGEAQFQTFLIQEQARHLARNGGLGLAASIFSAIKDTQDEP